MILLTIISVLLLALVCFLGWYIKNLLQQLIFVSENYGELKKVLDEFTGHLEIVYNMETYYGEPIIENLIKHSRHVTEYVKKFENIYSLTNEEDMEGEEDSGEEKFDNEESSNRSEEL